MPVIYKLTAADGEALVELLKKPALLGEQFQSQHKVRDENSRFKVRTQAKK